MASIKNFKMIKMFEYGFRKIKVLKPSIVVNFFNDWGMPFLGAVDGFLFRKTLASSKQDIVWIGRFGNTSLSTFFAT